MPVNYKFFPQIKLFSISSYSDALNHDLIYRYTNKVNVTKCRYLINPFPHNDTF